MKKKLLILLSLLMTLALAACSDNPGPGDETGGAETTEAPAETTSPVIEENPFTVPKDFDELRKMVIDCFDGMSQIKWKCRDTIDFSKERSYTTKLVYERGKAYYGLPYTSGRFPKACLNEFTDYLSDSGFYEGPTDYKNIVGSDCGSMRQAWAWGGALCGISIGNTDTTFDMFDNPASKRVKNVIIKVGDYDESNYSYNKPTAECIIANNDENTIYEAYALLQPCDLIGSRFRIADNVEQHVRMVVAPSEVVRLGNGKIAPSKSSVVFSEQTSTIRNDNGKLTTWALNQKMTFSELLQAGYLPRTTVTLAGGKIEEPVMTATGLNKAENLATASIIKGKITCNYNIFETEITITNTDTGEVVSHALVYPYDLQVMVNEIPLEVKPADLPKGNYRYTLTATIGFGTKTLLDASFSK